MKPARLLLALALGAIGCKHGDGLRADAAGGGAGLDEDGVLLLLPPLPGGASLRLGTQDPNHADRFTVEDGTPATPGSDGAIRYWTIPAYDFSYSSGGTGKTSRLHLYASGGQQQFTWKTQHGFLGSAADVRNQEFTVYARVRGVFDPARAAVTLKVRGGAHTASNGDLASCVMLTYAMTSAPERTRFGKELFHPDYDYVTLTPAFEAALTDGAWVGLKMVSYAAPGQPDKIVNRLYLDDAPFGADGRPANHWRLYSEYVDTEGVSTGKYSKLVDWGGWETTFRSDGILILDFAIVSVREIVPPSA